MELFPVIYPGAVCESSGHLPVDQLPVCLPVCHRICSCELLHHSGGDEEDEEGEGQHIQQTWLLFHRGSKTTVFIKNRVNAVFTDG